MTLPDGSTALVVLALLPALAASRPSPREKAFRTFDALLEKGLSENGIAGASFVFLHDGRIVHQKTAGLADPVRKIPVDGETIFHWASVTKTFTGVAVMQLRDRGGLSLDDPIVKYLPELAAVHDPFGTVDAITLRHLMTHSAGFREPTWPWGGDKPWQPPEPTRWAQLVAMLPYTEVLFKPGSRFSYSNPGVVFLGRVIELLTGDDYEVSVDKNILKPLGMTRTYFDRAPYHLLSHLSHSAIVEDGKRREGIFDLDTGITVSNGGLNAPLPDMAKWLAFLTGEAGNAVYEGVLKRSSLEEMWKPEIGVPKPGDRSEAMGLLFFVERRGGKTYIGHGGSQNGFVSQIYVHPPTRTAYAIAFNTDAVPAKGAAGEGTRALDRELRDALFADVFPRFDVPGAR
jgi:CubicO group peptidase (beta-lactamase class C family)